MKHSETLGNTYLTHAMFQTILVGYHKLDMCLTAFNIRLRLPSANNKTKYQQLRTVGLRLYFITLFLRNITYQGGWMEGRRTR